MAKCKHHFSDEELDRLYKKHGSYSKAAKDLGVSKTTFRQQYLKSVGKCIVCSQDLTPIDTSYTCNECLEKNRVDEKPSTKECEYCGTEIERKKDQSKISWSKKKGCEDCLEERYLKSLSETKAKNRHKYNKAIRESPKTKVYQKRYKNSKQGKLKLKVHNAKRRALKKTTASPYINRYIMSLYETYLECPYCESKDQPSIDHIVPLSRDGTHTEDNVELICLDCNRRKGNKTKDEYMTYLQSMKAEV